jgi:heme/copper-type cytochrome/quinol oxidase subunit 2
MATAQFLWDLCQRAFFSVCAAMGTTTLGFFVPVIVTPCVYLAYRFSRGGREAMRQHWRENVREAVLTAVTMWALLIIYHMVWVVPQSIDKAAISTHATPPSPPAAPDFSYVASLDHAPNEASISLKAESWDREKSFTWKHNLNVLMPVLNCFSIKGEATQIGWIVKDRSTVILRVAAPEALSCRARRQ